VWGFVVAWMLSEIINAGKFWLNPLLSEFEHLCYTMAATILVEPRRCDPNLGYCRLCNSSEKAIRFLVVMVNPTK
jgi:hypothetical protein